MGRLSIFSSGRIQQPARLGPTLVLCLGLALLTACTSAPSALPVPASGATLPAALTQGDQPEIATPKTAATSTPDAPYSRQAIAAAHPLAAEAGLTILRAGGSAVDAAIAAQVVLGLVEPQSSGLGGGAFLLVADGKSLSAWDGRETAPAEVDSHLFQDPSGRPLSFADAMASGLSVGVPGLLRMLEAAHHAHGRLPWARLFEPAIQLAEQGFPISPRLAAQLASDAWLPRDATARALFFDTDGKPWPVGHRLRNPEYAYMLRAIANEGADALYRGAIAQAIANAVQSHPLRPGRMTLQDLAGYRPVRREALCLLWRATRLCGMPPPSSGLLTIGQILRLSDMADGSASSSGAQNAIDSVRSLHQYIEASRLALADRDAYIADPAFTPAPGGDWRQLLDEGYLRQRASLIGPRAMPGAQAGKPPGVSSARATDLSAEVPATTHLSVVDGFGQAVAMTSSIEAQFGSRLMVNTGQGRLGGFLLNNQLTDFSFIAQRNGLPVANRVEAGKRPRSSMAPTLVFSAADGQLLASLGSPGGTAILHFVAKTLRGLQVAHLSVQQAIAAANIGPLSAQDGTPVWVECGAWPVTTLDGLRALGHSLREDDLPSGIQAIVRLPDGRWGGGADPRREGVVLGD